MMLEDFKKNMKNSIIEAKENINKQVEAYRTPNRLDQNRNSFCHKIVKTTNEQNKDWILKQ